MEMNLSPLEAMIVAINKKEVRERPSNEIKKDLEEFIKMIIIKCEDELLMLSGNAYIKAIKLDVPDNDKELTGKLDIYCQEFRKTALSITYDKKVVEKLLNECMTAIEVEMSCAPDCNTNIFIDLKNIIDCAIEKVERGLEND